jgi:hypothetical protein
MKALETPKGEEPDPDIRGDAVSEEQLRPVGRQHSSLLIADRLKQEDGQEMDRGLK